MSVHKILHSSIAVRLVNSVFSFLENAVNGSFLSRKTQVFLTGLKENLTVRHVGIILGLALVIKHKTLFGACLKGAINLDPIFYAGAIVSVLCMITPLKVTMVWKSSFLKKEYRR